MQTVKHYSKLYLILKSKAHLYNVYKQKKTLTIKTTWKGFPGGSDGKESTCSAEDPDSIPGSERCSGEGNSNPLWYSCLENSIDRAAGQTQSMGSQRVGQLNN